MNTLPSDHRPSYDVLAKQYGRRHPTVLGAAHADTEPHHTPATCSPRLGPDRTVEVAERLRALGHEVTPRIAARMVRDRDHLNRLLDDIEQVGIRDVFVIGGDVGEVAGPYSSAGELLPHVADHSRRPRTIGIAACPEGHPLIDDRTLATALEQKSCWASYMKRDHDESPPSPEVWSVAPLAIAAKVRVPLG
jgi:hypothetical protein